MRGLFGSGKKENRPVTKGHLFSIGKAPNYGKSITSKIKRIGRINIPRGKQKLFKIPVRIPRGIKI